jgi:hypothetical protein
MGRVGIIVLAWLAVVGASAQSLDRAGSLFAPYLEWTLENRGHSGNPFDVDAKVVFTHPSGETRTTGMFFGGRGVEWQNRDGPNFRSARSQAWVCHERGWSALGSADR